MFKHKLFRDVALLALTASFLGFQPASAARGERAPEEKRFDLPSLLSAHDPDATLSSLEDDLRKGVDDGLSTLVMADADLALQRNETGLYPNPSIQTYVNRLGQSIIPSSVSERFIVNFKILEDPFPYADAQATGTVYLSSGLVSLLDNESQLAFILMHEAGHVILSHHLLQVIEDEKAEKRQKRMALLGSAAGAVAGALSGGLATKGVAGAVGGWALGRYGEPYYSRYRNQRFLRELQIESDQFAVAALLDHGFDAREAPILMAKIGAIVTRSGPAVDLAFGYGQDLPPRSEKISEILTNYYKPLVDRVLGGEGFRMSSPRYSLLMSELKRDNGLLALKRDLFAIARSNLEEAASVRTDDPLTMYGLGLLYRAIGRTDEDHTKAGSYLKSAIEFDEVRHRFPQAYLEYAVELLSREDPRLYPDIQKALKKFVVLHQRQSGGKLPREMRYVYDYLDLTGDRSWIAYAVDNISSEPPYQRSGDPEIDGNAQPPAEKVLTKPIAKPAAKPRSKNKG